MKSQPHTPMTATAEAPPARKLRITDPRLPITVSRAALELDRASRGEQADLSKAREFFDFLTNAISSDSPSGDPATMWLDPVTVDVFGQALEGSGRVQGLRTVQDVIREALRLVQEIDETASLGLGKDLAGWRSFCVAFGNSLLAHRAQYRPEPPINPHRR